MAETSPPGVHVSASALAAPVAPSTHLRRLILGGAFLVGLAAAILPDSPPAAAQAPKAQATITDDAGKTVTITAGPGGVETKIERKPANPPAGGAGDAADPDEPAVVIEKQRKRVHVGIGSDREFDSFNQLVETEPWLAVLIFMSVLLVFLVPLLIIIAVIWYKVRKTRMLNETMLRLAEKGVVPAGDAMQAIAGSRQADYIAAAASTAPLLEQARAVRKRAAWSDLRKGIIMTAIGLGLTFFSMLDDGSPNGIGLVLLFVGVGYVILWWFEDRQLPPAAGGPPSGA
jgi:hypothetical protein